MVKTFLGEFMRYVVVGGIAFLVDFAVLWLAQAFWFGAFACGVYISTALGFCVGFVVNYVLSLVMVFTRKRDRVRGRQFGAFSLVALIAVTGLLLTELGMWLGVDLLKWDYRLVKIFVTGGVLMWNFLARKIWVFN